jgi:predicted  nucleic acid-binding Zn-ribbon protein
MKYIAILFASFLIIASQSLFAQDQITDEELKKYVVTMDSINDMKASLLEEINEMVKANEGLTNARYNELSKIINDEAKLAAAKATPEEIAFMKQVAEKKSEGTAEITQTFQTLAKEYVGAASFNKIKKALATDTELKSKYQSMLDELEKSDVN